jgi:hypothetical protein
MSALKRPADRKGQRRKFGAGLARGQQVVAPEVLVDGLRTPGAAQKIADDARARQRAEQRAAPQVARPAQRAQQPRHGARAAGLGRASGRCRESRWG